MTQSLGNLQERIQLTFKNTSLLENVFVHRSYLNENKTFELTSNEKLEFLGDSVLSLVTSIHLFKAYSDLQEGDYTDIKASIVRTESLAEAASALDLGSYLLLSHGEQKGNGRTKANLLADTFEALIAAIFLEFGFDKASSFIHTNLFNNRLDSIISSKLYLSPKSRLQERAQAIHKELPEYKLLESTGPEHDKQFKVAVLVKNIKLGEGEGSSKKQAEEQAAQNALDVLM
ncbi:MAG: ribonuclease III [bacterium]|nr:ribonuclease III [bacterium]